MQLFANNARSKLTVGITNIALTLQVKTGEGAQFPNPTGGDYFLLTLSKISGGIETDIEIVRVTARSSDVFTIVRAQEGTTAKTYAEDDHVQLRMTAASAAAAEAHIDNVANPHSTTKAQVGLGNVDNTSDVDKPVSTAQATAIGLKYDKTGGVVTGNVTVNTGADSRVLVQSTGVTQGQLQATATQVRLASNNALPLVLSTNGNDRVNLDGAGNVTFGDAAATGIYTFKGAGTNDLVVIESTDAASTAAPDVVLYRNSASPAASDQLGVIIWRGKDSGAADQQYARMGATLVDPTAASEDGELWFEINVAGAAVERMRLNAAGATVTGAVSATSFTGAGTGLTGTAASLTAGVASAVPWSGVSSKPTTLTGFGITDGVSAIGSDGVVTRQMFRDTGMVYFDSNTTNALDYTNGSMQRWAPNTGAQSLTITNWPPTGNMGELLIQGVNLGAATITWPAAALFIKSDGTTSNFAGSGVTLQASGTDFVYMFTRDGGTTIYVKVIR